jgi:uncharacterized alpha-E superfamily protein
MLSRVANSIYWMSRYVERAENIARMIDVNHNLLLDMPADDVEQWRPLVMITGAHKTFAERYGEAFTRDNVIEFLTFDRDNPNSISACLNAARENARSVREVISSEMWEHLNAFYLSIRDRGARWRVEHEPAEWFQHIKLASHLFGGLTDTTMTHGEGWQFANVGRLLERADKTSRILDVKYFILLPSVEDVGSPLDDIQWSALLRSISGFEMYRKQYGRITPLNVVEFLLLDQNFPRSILFCLIGARDSLHAISGTPAGRFANQAEQRLGKICADLAYTTVQTIIEGGLHEFVDNLQLSMNLVDDAIFDTFFAMRPTTDAALTV